MAEVKQDTAEATQDTNSDLVSVTPAASAKIQQFLAQYQTQQPADAEPESLVLRLEVEPGGCSGLQRSMYFDADEQKKGDTRIELDGGVVLTVDKMSAPYYEGATVDYLETIEQSGFTIDAPNMAASCSCGKSFG